MCLQYDDKVIISGSSDSTVRVWSVHGGEMVNTLIHHCEAVLHLRFNNGMMVTCSKVRYYKLSVTLLGLFKFSGLSEISCKMLSGNCTLGLFKGICQYKLNMVYQMKKTTFLRLQLLISLI